MRLIREKTRGRRSLRHVAASLGEDHSVVSRWERGMLEVRVVDLVRFASACGVEPSTFLKGVSPLAVEQLVLGLQPEVGRKVLDLVEVLRARRQSRYGRPDIRQARRGAP